ncbi:TPA: DUF550 domain-containing protein [Klebsiella quasipneumoniae subsp. similipneumoniae]
MSEFSRETLLNIIETDHVQCGEASALARMALAAMDSESGCLPLDYLQGHKDGLEWAAQLAEANHPETGDWLYDDPIELAKAIRKGPDMPPAQPAKDREQVRREHAEWSQATFGNVGPVGPLKHLSKEALEAAEQPGDLSEWADMQFLLWDAQRRAGITDEQITQAMIEKLAVNKQREWPEPKDGEPRLHIKEQPAPIASVCTCPSGDGSLRWPCPAHPGNSPAQSDCCPEQNHVSPAQNSVAPAQSPIDHGYRPECECSGCKATARICAELSANSSANPDCWCRTCRPVDLNDMRFVVCPDCGNKRCPRANDHRNACSGSNEPGQEGSAYPDTPREVK